MYKKNILLSLRRSRKRVGLSLIKKVSKNLAISRKNKRDESIQVHNISSKEKMNKKEIFEFDCSKGNILSSIFDRKILNSSYSSLEYFYFWFTISIIFYGIPLVIVLFTQPSLWQKSNLLHMPFFLDAALPLTQLILTPLLILNLMTERRLLNKTLNQLFDGPVKGVEASIEKDINRFYKSNNKKAIIIGIVFSIIMTFLWAKDVLGNEKISWYDYGSTISNEHFNFIGYYCTILLVGFFWILLSSTAIRYFFHYRVFKRITENERYQINIIPLHPDKCGGLYMVSNLVKLNQPIIFAVGLVLAGNYFNNIVFLKKEIYALTNIGMIVGFIILSILAFVLPLLPYRKVMIKAKDSLLNQISRYFNNLWQDGMTRVKKQNIENVDIHKIEELKILYDLASLMPVWPYNWNTLKKFLSYSLIPIFTMVISTIVDLFFGKAIDRIIF